MPHSNPYHSEDPVDAELLRTVPPDELETVGFAHRRMITVQPVVANIYIASWEGARAARRFMPETAFVNLTADPLVEGDDCAHHLPDEPGHSPDVLKEWILKVVASIDDCVERQQPVVVSCRAGCDRSVLAVVAWMLLRSGVRAEDPYNVRFKHALDRIEAVKKVAARRYKVKSRWQSFDPDKPSYREYSWPSLLGRAVCGTLVFDGLNALASIVLPAARHDVEMAKGKPKRARPD
tara:strand:- start:166 stop:873 length:708 start_codon:yes stop_codon:yes gene_type:complete